MVPFKYSTNATQGAIQQPQQGPTNQAWRGGILSDPARPRDKACQNFNKGMCSSKADHANLFYVCIYCLYMVQRLCQHMEQCCHRKYLPKMGHGGLRSNTPIQHGFEVGRSKDNHTNRRLTCLAKPWEQLASLLLTPPWPSRKPQCLFATLLRHMPPTLTTLTRRTLGWGDCQRSNIKVNSIESKHFLLADGMFVLTQLVPACH